MIWKGGGIPFGYSYDHGKDVLIVNNHEKEILQKIFSLALSSGASAIAEYLNSNSLYSRQNKLWSNITVRYLLSPKRLLFYLGQMDEAKGNWKPLLTQSMYNKLSKINEEKSTSPLKSPKTEYLLTGIGVLYCGYCGSRVKSSITVSKKGNREYYNCSCRMVSGKSSCPDSRLVRMDTVDPLVISDVASRVHVLAEVFEQYKVHASALAKKNIEKLSKQLHDLDKAPMIMEQINKELERTKLTFPFSGRIEVVRENLPKLLESVLMYRDKIVLNYRFPFNKKFEFTKELPL